MRKSAVDQLRLDKIHNMPCICCTILSKPQPSKTEAHHLVDGGYREHSGGHQASLPLCGWHHRSEPIRYGEDYSKKAMLIWYGPSLKFQGGRGKFVERWGTERALLARVNDLLGEV